MKISSPAFSQKPTATVGAPEIALWFGLPRFGLPLLLRGADHLFAHHLFWRTETRVDPVPSAESPLLQVYNISSGQSFEHPELRGLILSEERP